MNKKKIMIISASLLMLAAVSVKPAMAYFTDTHKSVGTVMFGNIDITPHERLMALPKQLQLRTQVTTQYLPE